MLHLSSATRILSQNPGMSKKLQIQLWKCLFTAIPFPWAPFQTYFKNSGSLSVLTQTVTFSLFFASASASWLGRGWWNSTSVCPVKSLKEPDKGSYCNCLEKACTMDKNPKGEFISQKDFEGRLNHSLKKNANYLSVTNVFSTKVLIVDTIFMSPTGDGTFILHGHLGHAKVSPFAWQRQYLHFSVILRPWVLVQPQESSLRPPILQSSPLLTELIVSRERSSRLHMMANSLK